MAEDWSVRRTHSVWFHFTKEPRYFSGKLHMTTTDNTIGVPYVDGLGVGSAGEPQYDADDYPDREPDDKAELPICVPGHHFFPSLYMIVAASYSAET